MPLAFSDILAMINEELAGFGSRADPVAESRRRFLIEVQAMIRELGFPLPEERKLDACIMPFIFQELNYDDYDWTSRTSPLGPLESLVNIDVAIWSNGCQRSELTDAIYADYSKFCLKCIEHRLKR
jgi:hypothetical protein